MFNISSFKFWKKKPEGNIHEFISVPFTYKRKGWRNGMWVWTTQGKPAILVDQSQDGALVHYVNIDTGETTEEVMVSWNDLRQCKYKEIPLCRRGFDEETARSLGYGT